MDADHGIARGHARARPARHAHACRRIAVEPKQRVVRSARVQPLARQQNRAAALPRHRLGCGTAAYRSLEEPVQLDRRRYRLTPHAVLGGEEVGHLRGRVEVVEQGPCAPRSIPARGDERVLGHAVARMRRDRVRPARHVDLRAVGAADILQGHGVHVQMGDPPHDQSRFPRRPRRQVQLHRDGVPGHGRRPVDRRPAAVVANQLRARHRLDLRARPVRIVEAHLQPARRFRDLQLHPQPPRPRRHDRQRGRPAASRQILPHQVAGVRCRPREAREIAPESDARRNRRAGRPRRRIRGPFLAVRRRGQHDPLR